MFAQISARSIRITVLLWFLLILSACNPIQNNTLSRPIETNDKQETNVSLRFIGTPNGIGYELDAKIIEQFTAETGIQVEFVAGPESATDRIALYSDLLNQQSTEFDVYQIDVIWPGILGKHFITLSPHLQEEAHQHFPAIIENNTVNGRFIAMPFFTDVGLLYYRSDLLEKYGYAHPPQTWDELEEMADTIQTGERAKGNLEFWGFVWQGAAYEGLTCDALEWQVSHDGGTIIEADGTISVNNPNTIAALERAANWIDYISPPEITGFQEEDARSIWHVGNAAFMRNWPYAYATSQAEDSFIYNKFDVTALPSNGTVHAGTLGGWQLAVSQYTNHQEEAIALVRYLSSKEVQKQRAIEGSYLPTIPSLYDDTAVLRQNPFFGELKDIFLGGAVARPSNITGAHYNEISIAYFTAVHQVLTQQIDAESALLNLEKELTQIVTP